MQMLGSSRAAAAFAFTQEPRLGLFVVEQMSCQKLECDGPFQLGVLSLGRRIGALAIVRNETLH